MKRIQSAFQWFCLLLLNAMPFILNVLFFRTGSVDDLLLFVPVYIVLLMLNYKLCKELKHFVLVQLFMLIYIVVSNIASTNLYYQIVSDDPMTPVVGKLFLYLEAGILLISTAIAALRKAKR